MAEEEFEPTPEEHDASVAALWGFIQERTDYTGILVDIEVEEGVHVRFRIARAGGWNVRFKDAFSEGVEPHQLAIEGEQLSVNAAQHILATVYAEAVVLEWWGDNLPEFTSENVRLWLIRHRPVLEHIVEVAEEPAYFADGGIIEG